MLPRLAWTLPLLAIAACAPTPPPAPPPPPPPAVPGMEKIIGQPVSAATALLGTPTLDRSEGRARALQFARAGCVLDIYYWPDPRGAQPVATFAEARLRDGRPQEAGACLAQQLAGSGAAPPAAPPATPPK